MILQEARQLSGLSKKPRLKHVWFSAGRAQRKIRVIFNYAGDAEQGSNETGAMKDMMIGIADLYWQLGNLVGKTPSNCRGDGKAGTAV
jgi:hypothetical protein